MTNGYNTPIGVPIGLPSILSLGLPPLINPFPTLNLDFINNPQFDSRITFSRGSQATLFDSTGTLVYAKQNLLLQSQDFATTWTASNISVSANSVTAPDGTNTADTLTGAAGSGLLKRIFQSPVIPAATCTFSVFAKAGTHNFIQFFYSGVGATTYANFDISTGTAGDFNGVSSSITAVGNGWYRCTHTFVANNTSVNISLVDSNTAARGATTSTTNNVYLWGAQLNIANMEGGVTSSLTTYYPTTTAAYYAPRFDYNPSTLQPRGLLIEEQRTNLLTYSDDFANAAWTKSEATITSNTIVAPDGTLTGDKLVDNTNNALHFTLRALTVTANANYAYTVFVKKGDFSNVRVRYGKSLTPFTRIGIIYNFDTGAITNSDVGTPTSVTVRSATPVGNGWVRLCVAGIFDTTSTDGLVEVTLIDNSGNSTFTGNGANGTYVWGAQLEAGAFATSYIPTTTTALTRNADVASMTGTNFSSWYNQSEGSFYANFVRQNITIGYVFGQDTTASNNGYGVTKGSTGIIVVQNADGITNVTIGTSNVDVDKVAFGYSSAGLAGAFNGNAAVVSTVPPSRTPISLIFGNNRSGTSNLNGHIQRIAYYPTRLPDATLVALTS